jgi:hypothetical protein
MDEDRAAEGVEHLQAAALELIAAARAFLDVAEDLVTDPEGVTGTLASLAAFVDLAGRAAGRRGGGHAAPAAGHEEPGPLIRRIQVS